MQTSTTWLLVFLKVSKALELIGVGYRAQVQGNKLTLNVGYSHPVEMTAPEGVTFEVPANTQVIVKGINKEVVGELAANIRGVRPPEPIKAKGFAMLVNLYAVKKVKLVNNNSCVENRSQQQATVILWDFPIKCFCLVCQLLFP